MVNKNELLGDESPTTN